jgi:hypothetical protein
MMLGLRLTGGLRSRDHAAAAWRAVEARYARSFSRALATGRLEPDDHGVRIPAALRFVADDVIAWIDADAESSRFDRRTTPFLTSWSCPSPPSRVA